MTISNLETLEYLIDVARQKSGKKASHSADLQSCFQAMAACFTMSRHNRALARELPDDRIIPLLNPERIQERIIADPAGFGGIRDYAEAFNISPAQMAGLLRGEVDIETDLSQMFALSDAVGLHLDLQFFPKDQEPDLSTPDPRTEASAESPAPAPRAG